MIFANPFARIVVGYDDSPAADIALEQALALAQQYAGDVVVVHISDVPVNAIFQLETTAEGPKNDLTPLIASLKGRHASLFAKLSAHVAYHPVPVSLEFSMNEAAAGILDAAKRWDATAIAVGTHARTGVSRALIGSVAEGIVRGALVPVIVVREKMSAKPLHRIVVGIDPSEFPTSARAMAVALAREHSVRLVYCSVVDTATIVQPIADMPFDPTHLITGMRRAAHDALEAAAQDANASGVYPDIEVIDAVDAATGIVDVARRHDANAIVVGNHKRGDLERFFIGSTAEAVMWHSNISVIVVPSSVTIAPSFSAVAIG
jgi:nucleotide-binding universal stress UspA family protein